MTFATELAKAQSKYDAQIPEDDRTDEQIESDLAQRLREQQRAAELDAARARMAARLISTHRANAT